MMKIRLYFICFLLLELMFTLPAYSSPFSQAIFFGDSLSDTGNLETYSSGIYPGSGYYDGRFSNGFVWDEYFSQQLQLSAPIPNLDSSAGRNYAFGGAMTVGSGLQSLFITDINEQVSDFINNDGGPSANDLVVVWGGANDLINGQTNVSIPVNNLATSITNLYNAGARSFMVVNLPLLGQTPRYNGTANEAVFDARSLAFNSALDTSLDNLEISLADVTFYRVDAGSLIASAVADPAAYGFTNVTDEAMGLTGIDPDTYLFWDDIHPTTAAHNLLAQQAAQTLFDALYTLPGDLNLDGLVDIDDLNVVLANWNTEVYAGNPLFGDPSGDGIVSIEDLNAVLSNWNAGTPANADCIVPEPGTWAIQFVLTAGWFTRRRYM